MPSNASTLPELNKKYQENHAYEEATERHDYSYIPEGGYRGHHAYSDIPDPPLPRGGNTSDPPAYGNTTGYEVTLQESTESHDTGPPGNTTGYEVDLQERVESHHYINDAGPTVESHDYVNDENIDTKI